MPKSDETSLVVVGEAQYERSDSLAEMLEVNTGLRAKSFRGVRDPSTGAVQRYVAIDAPVVDVTRITSGAGRVCVDSVGAACTYRSISTIKADIAARIYNTSGKDIVWALFDTGVDRHHPHFKFHDNLSLASPLRHIDLVARDGADDPLVDENGHGTFVAGIIAGENRNTQVAERVVSDAPDHGHFIVSEVPFISGMAPKCKILSVKVLGADGGGKVSDVIEGLSQIQRLNDGGRQLLVHGINLGVGFDYEVSRFACGKTPLCMEVDRMVRSGVVIVTAAGNLGFEPSRGGGMGMHGIEVSIQDPGNAELAITVGSTHRELPQMYGVSYFSSKGPTLDGRVKPDVVAPGERIVSCATGVNIRQLADDGKNGVYYIEMSGTSMATAHVSGACAALLSARNELKGQPESLKNLLMETAIDLRRSRFFQGRGMIDVLQAVQTNIPSTLGRTDEHFNPQARVSPSLEPPAAPNYGAKTDTHSLAPLRVMYSYAHDDEQYKNELHIYLGGMRNQGLIDAWQDRLILPGAEFDKDIAKALEESDIIILLVTAPFLDSKYCWGIEMTRAVQRHSEGTAKVVPIILKPTPSWRETPFGKLTALPKDGKPVTTWENRDLAWTEVAEELRRLVVAMSSGNRT